MNLEISANCRSFSSFPRQRESRPARLRSGDPPNGSLGWQWYRARTADRRPGTRKTMIVALARKLLIALWRFVTTGETLDGVILRPAG